MIGANQFRGVTRRLVANRRAAVAADIVQGVNRAIIATRDDDGIRVHLHGEKISGLRNLARMPREKPAGAPDPGDIVAVNLFIRIELSR